MALGLLAAGLMAGSGLVAGAARTGNAAVQSQLDRENKIQLQQNDQNFQEHMASTNYQRQVADMKLAGLNPAMAAATGQVANITSSNEQDKTGAILSTLSKYFRETKAPHLSNIRSK